MSEPDGSMKCTNPIWFVRLRAHILRAMATVPALSERARRWLASAVALASVAAIVATSAPPRYLYSFSTELDPISVELTSDSPSVRLRLYARALGFAPNGGATTASAAAFIEGRIASEAVAGDVPGAFVIFRTSFQPGDAGSQEISALTEFHTSSELIFEGDCEALSGADPCDTELFIELRREDGGAGSGTVRAELNVTLSASVDKGEQAPDEGPLELPWDVVLERTP